MTTTWRRPPSFCARRGWRLPTRRQAAWHPRAPLPPMFMLAPSKSAQLLLSSCAVVFTYCRGVLSRAALVFMLGPVTLVVQLVIVQLVMVQRCCYAYCRGWCVQHNTCVQAGHWKVTGFLNLCLAMCYCMVVESPDPSSMNCTDGSVAPSLSHVGVGSSIKRDRLCSMQTLAQGAAACSESARFTTSLTNMHMLQAHKSCPR